MVSSGGKVIMVLTIEKIGLSFSITGLSLESIKTKNLNKFSIIENSINSYVSLMSIK